MVTVPAVQTKFAFNISFTLTVVEVGHPVILDFLVMSLPWSESVWKLVFGNSFKRVALILFYPHPLAFPSPRSYIQCPSR